MCCVCCVVCAVCCVCCVLCVRARACACQCVCAYMCIYVQVCASVNPPVHGGRVTPCDLLGPTQREHKGGATYSGTAVQEEPFGSEFETLHPGHLPQNKASQSRMPISLTVKQHLLISKSRHSYSSHSFSIASFTCPHTCLEKYLPKNASHTGQGCTVLDDKLLPPQTTL